MKMDQKGKRAAALAAGAALSTGNRLLKLGGHGEIRASFSFDQPSAQSWLSSR